MRGTCDLTTVKIERCCPRVTVCDAVNWRWGNDHCDVALAGLIMYSRDENILGNTLAVANNRI